MKKLSFVMITCNRPLIVDDYIKTVKNYFVEMDISLIIVDGSSNNDTKNIVTKYKYEFICYYHLDGFDFGERVIKGIELSEAKYVCITGDSQIPLINNMDRVFELINDGYDLINLSYRDNKNLKRKSYTDIVEMCKDNCWDMTLFGSVFFKKSSYKPIQINDLKKYKDTSSQNIYYFNNFNSENFLGYYESLPILTISKLKEKSVVMFNKFDTFTRLWYYTIEDLDEKYDAYKNDILYDHSKYSSLKLNTVKGVLRFRYNDSFNMKYLRENKDILSKVTRLDYYKLFIIACIPKKSYTLMTFLYRKIKGE